MLNYRSAPARTDFCLIYLDSVWLYIQRLASNSWSSCFNIQAAETAGISSVHPCDHGCKALPSCKIPFEGVKAIDTFSRGGKCTIPKHKDLLSVLDVSQTFGVGKELRNFKIIIFGD